MWRCICVRLMAGLHILILHPDRRQVKQRVLSTAVTFLLPTTVFLLQKKGDPLSTPYFWPTWTSRPGGGEKVWPSSMMS